jgi:hypothetical protein
MPPILAVEVQKVEGIDEPSLLLPGNLRQRHCAPPNARPVPDDPAHIGSG